MSEKRRIPFAIWKVDGVEYKLKLTTSGIMTLENKLKTNLLNVMGSGDNMPALSIMLMIAHEAMQKYNHGVSEDDVVELFDKYCDEGGSQISFMTDVFIPIYQASGFLSESHSEKMTKEMEKAKKMLE